MAYVPTRPAPGRLISCVPPPAGIGSFFNPAWSGEIKAVDWAGYAFYAALFISLPIFGVAYAAGRLTR